MRHSLSSGRISTCEYPPLPRKSAGPPYSSSLALVRWSVSMDYFDLRTRLGLALISEEDVTPVVARTDQVS